MKASQLVPLAMLSLLTMSNSCEKETPEVAPDPCSPSQVALATMPNFSATPACFRDATLQIGESKQQLITSTDQFRTEFTCANPPAIDFDRFTLLAGQTKMPTDSRVVSQQVVRSCKKYTYVVKIQQGMGAAITITKYQALVPKIEPDATVDFDVQVLP